jgi:putative transposase
MAAGVLGSVLIGCAIRAIHGITSGSGGYKGDGLEFTQKNQKADPQATQSTAYCPNRSQLDMVTRFMYDTLHYGRPFRALNVIDESNREILAIEIDISLPVARVVRTWSN